MIQHTNDLIVVGWSDTAAEMFGYGRDEAMGKRLPELLWPGSDGEAWRRLLAEDGAVPRILACTRKDGGEVACAWLHAPALDAQGATVGVVCFGEEVSAPDTGEAERALRAQLLRTFLDNVPIVVWAVDREGTFTFHEGKGMEPAGLRQRQYVGQSFYALYPDEEKAGPIRRALQGEVVHTKIEAHDVLWESWDIPIVDNNGQVTGVAGLTLDISSIKQTERELREQLELVARQQRVIRQLSTPIIQVWDRVLTLPMIGVLDSTRTADVMQNLLDEVSRTQARFAILDLTGVDAVDTKTATYLIELVRAIRLLGAEGIITGIRSNVAQTMVTLGLDLSGIVTLSNLSAGLRHCIANARRQESPRLDAEQRPGTGT